MTHTYNLASQSLEALEAHEQRSRSTLMELGKVINELNARRNEMWESVREDGARQTDELVASMELGMEGIRSSLFSEMSRDVRAMSAEVREGCSVAYSRSSLPFPNVVRFLMLT
jgi:F0F1-type ATP synthase membrane subunit b/b'